MTAQDKLSYRITAGLFRHCDFCLCYRKAVAGLPVFEGAAKPPRNDLTEDMAVV